MDLEATLALAQALTKVLVDNQLDSLKLGDFEIKKSKHLSKVDKEQVVNNKTSSQGLLDEDEVLFYSTSSKPLSAEELEMLAENGSGLYTPKKQKRSKKSEK